MLRNRLLAIGALPVVAAVVLGVEAVIAVRAPWHDTAPFDLRRPGASVDAPKVVWIGDSTASGVGASKIEKTLPVQLARRSGDVDLTVLAISGSTAADVLLNQVPKLKDIDPDIVYISVGANDTTHVTREGDFRDDYEGIRGIL